MNPRQPAPLIQGAAQQRMAQALSLHQQGQLEQAERLYLSLQGQHPDAGQLLGALWLQQGHHQRAADLLAQEIKRRRHPAAEKNLIIAYKRLNQPALALAVCEQALVDQPDDEWLQQNAAEFAWAVQNWDRCAFFFAQWLRLNPGRTDNLSNLGAVLHKLGRFEEAATLLEKCVNSQPHFSEAWINLAIVKRDLDDLDGALHCYLKAIEIDAKSPRAHVGIGEISISNRNYLKALKHFHQSVLQDDTQADAWYGIGMSGVGLRKFEIAREAFQRCLNLDSMYEQTLGHLLHSKMLCADWDQLAALQSRMEQSLRQGQLCVDPFVLMTVCEDEALLKQGTELFIDKFHPIQAPLIRPVRRAPRDRIRVGYVSGEFRQHATSVLMVELWEQHKPHVDLVAFDNGQSDGSPMRQRLEAAFDEIVPIRHLSDEAAAHAVAERDIDVLINLNGFFGHARNGLFSRRPAPVQVNYLGFPGTIGAPYIDYIFADERVIPKASEPYFTEQVIHVGPCYQPRDQRARPKVKVAREETGLPEAAFVYCCFNKTYKLTPVMWAVWMRVLKQVPGSVLWLLSETDRTAERLRQAAHAHGVDPARLYFADRWPHERHLARHALADLFLDTLPCNAHTTAADALLAGLPVLTCEGKTFAGRVASSLLHHHGMAHWVAPDLVAYEAMAIAAAGSANAQRLIDRQTLQQVRHEDYSPYFEALRRVHAMGPRQR